jgi:site-specific recombinase XerD
LKRNWKGNPPPVRSDEKKAIMQRFKDLEAFKNRVQGEGYRAGLEAAAEIIRKYLMFNSQRAVSWHEVNDAMAAIREMK